MICSTDEYHDLVWETPADRLGIPFDRERNNLLRGVSCMASLEIILDECAALRFGTILLPFVFSSK